MIMGVSILTCFCKLLRNASRGRITISIIILYLKSNHLNNMRKLTTKMGFLQIAIIKEQI